MINFRRLSVTLLELMVVMAILSIAAGIVAIGISRALVDQRFRTDVSLIVDELRLAQDLMIVLGTDVHVKFGKNDDGEGIKFWLELETELPSNIKSQLITKQHVVKTVRVVYFNDLLEDTEDKEIIDIKFLSGGFVMSKGIMKMATSEENNEGVLSNYICLAGYPCPIDSIDNKEKADELFASLENTEFDEALTQDTLSRLPEKLKKQEEAPKVEEKAKQSANPSGTAPSPGQSKSDQPKTQPL